MALTGTRTFVGFGFGAIQSGLFLYEAFQSGNFHRLVVAEIMPDVVSALRLAGNVYSVNVAYHDRVEVVQVGPIEILNPAMNLDRQKIIEAIEEAEEIATAVPGVSFYNKTFGSADLSSILKEGLQLKLMRGGPRVVIYTAENDNHAAEILRELVLAGLSPAEQNLLIDQVCFLNTVIGKMSGVVSDPAEIATFGLTPMTPGSERAFLVEVFNHILISRISFDGTPFQPGITSFIEKDDLLPFEEVKLYGHNATHALGAYLGAFLGARQIADLPDIPGMMTFLRRAFLEESGAALIHRYRGLDPLFTPIGYAAYVDDLLTRMCNPYLSDTVERVGRDVERKLGWDDRLVGTLRLALAEGVYPGCYSLGVAAALVWMDSTFLNEFSDPAERLSELWGGNLPISHQEPVLELIRDRLTRLRYWVATSPDKPCALLVNH